MAAAQSITRTYQTQDLTIEVPFRKDGFFNATAVAKAFGKEPYEWLRLPTTVEYTAQLVDSIQSAGNPRFDKNQLVIVKKGAPETGGGTWLHPKPYLCPSTTVFSMRQSSRKPLVRLRRTGSRRMTQKSTSSQLRESSYLRKNK